MESLEKNEGYAPKTKPKTLFLIESKAKEVLDILRTAPVGLSFFSIGAYCAYLSPDPSVSAGFGFGGACGITLAIKQFILRKRLERIVSEKGYDDRIFKKTIIEWCDRQTAMIVARNSGNLEEYQELCSKNRNKISYPQLPNF